MLLRFAYLEILFILVPLVLVAIAYRLWRYTYPVYQYPIAQQFISSGAAVRTNHKKIYFLLRSSCLIVLALLIARPQWVDESSSVFIKGIDIVIAMDLSGSMQIFDDLQDRRSRITVAQQEAIRFIDKRVNDPIGIVIFAKDAISRSPLTLDKRFLKEIVGSLEIGFIDPQGTSLGTGLALAVNRLKDSDAKSRIVVLLTDGMPTPGEKVDPPLAMDLAKEFGVKVYTIGIGNEKGGYFIEPMTRSVIQQQEQGLNVELLKQIADQTGGKFFRAKNPRDMRVIYDTIDLLERTEHKADIFHKYYEAFLSFIWIVLVLLGAEILLRCVIWRGV